MTDDDDSFWAAYDAKRAARQRNPLLTHKNTPMFPLLQLNVTEAGAQSGLLADCALITVFLSPDFQSLHHTQSVPEGEAGFAVRTYTDLSRLVPVNPPKFETTVKPFECTWLDPVDDYPNHDLAGEIIDPMEVDIYEFDWCQTNEQTKLGGWPATIQSEPWWMYQPEAPEVGYVFQVSGVEKAHWYCDSMFFARGREDRSLWALDVQMF